MLVDKPNTPPSSGLYKKVMFIGLLGLGAGLVFKLMHWPAATLLMIIGGSGIFFGAVFLFLTGKK
ncbi:MAG: hypothetical protein IT233_05985 [Bacteroidia bacterium]|nr:hypothetical protein [Bacteroidia bacterium]